MVVVLLALDGIGGLYGISSFNLSQLETLGMVFSMELMFVLAVVSWMETKGGALLVTFLLVIKFIEGIIVANLYLIPEYGPQWGQYVYSTIYLFFAVFSYLSYRKIIQSS